jgi:hypothetical protein
MKRAEKARILVNKLPGGFFYILCIQNLQTQINASSCLWHSFFCSFGRELDVKNQNLGEGEGNSIYV